MIKRERLAIIVILLSISPLSSSYIAKFSVRYTGEKSEVISSYLDDIRTFRLHQLCSGLLTLGLFLFAIITSLLFESLKVSNVSWIPIISALLLTHTAFNQLAWEFTWGNDSLLDFMNKWSFRIYYSIGILILFYTLLK